MRQSCRQIVSLSLAKLRKLRLFEIVRDNAQNSAAFAPISKIGDVKHAIGAVNDLSWTKCRIGRKKKFGAGFIRRTFGGHFNPIFPQSQPVNAMGLGICHENIRSEEHTSELQSHSFISYA